MSRAYSRITALVVATLGCTWTLSACARDTAPAPVRVAQANAPAQGLAQWKPGTNYTLLAAPQPTNVAKGKIEVDEIFWYACGHCYALDPTLESWKQNKAAYIEFVRIPVMWGPVQKQHARIYYTLQALGRPDLHAKVFDAIHRDHNPLAAQEDADARAMHLAFFTAHGITEKDFNNAYDSMSVATNLQRAQEATYRYGVASVPLIIVNGKYSTDVSMAGGAGELMAIINDLAASEKRR